MSTRFWNPSHRLPSDDDNAFNEDELEMIIDLVRDSSFPDDTSGSSIEERMTEVFGGDEPEWIGFQSPDATCYVNCYGTVRHEGHSSELALQFELSEDIQQFMLTAMLVDGEEQNEFFIADFEGQFAGQ